MDLFALYILQIKMFLSAHLLNSLRNKSLILSFYYDLLYSIFLRFAFEIFYRFLTVGTTVILMKIGP